MKRIVLGSFIAVAIVTAVAWSFFSAGSRGRASLAEPDASMLPEPIPGPAAVPLGETTQQSMPGPDGGSEVWTLHKREAEREEIVAELIPQPLPRDSPAGPNTDSARALNGQALEAWKTGSLLEALDLFESAVEADPDDWVPRADYGRLLVMMTDYEKAGPHLERAAELNPDSPRVWLDLYSYYQRSMQLERGFHAAEKARALAGGREIVQDETGLWRLEGDSIYP